MSLRRWARLASALVPPTIRAIRWWPLLLALALGFGVLLLALRPKQVPDQVSLLLWLRVAAVFGALGVTFLLDDPSEPTTEGAAVSLLLRRAVRIALAAPILLAWWALILSLCEATVPRLPVPVAALVLEAVALTTLALALAAIGARLAPERLGGVFAAPVLLLLVWGATVLPVPAALFVAPGAPAWTGAHQRWAAVLVLAMVLLALASRTSPQPRLLTGATDPAGGRA